MSLQGEPRLSPSVAVGSMDFRSGLSKQAVRALQEQFAGEYWLDCGLSRGDLLWQSHTIWLLPRCCPRRRSLLFRRDDGAVIRSRYRDHVRNKHPADMTTFRPDRTVLYVHGATFRPPRHSIQARWHVMDGLYRRPRLRRLPARPARLRQVDTAEGNEPDAGSQPPIVRGDTAVKDIGTAVDFMLARRKSAPETARMVVGHDADGNLHHAKRQQGRAAGALRAGLDPQTASLVQAGPARSPPIARSSAIRRSDAG